jgi:hypothetical protein
MIVRYCALLFLWIGVANCHAQESNPSAVVSHLYRQVIATHPLGIPEGSDLESVKPFISTRMLRKLIDVKACEKSFYLSHEHDAGKPPFVWLEKGVFSGENELALPTRATVVKIEPQKNGSYIVHVQLEYIPIEKKENTHFKWDVEVSVISERSRFAVDDVYLSGNGSSRERISLYGSFPGCDGLSWNGK